MGHPGDIPSFATLGAPQRPQILDHLLALGADDRYLRFGYPAEDEQIRRYVERIAFDRDDVYGLAEPDGTLRAYAHLAYAPDVATAGPGSSGAEFGVSVATAARGHGLGAALFDHAVQCARARGVDTIVIHALNENEAMLRIVRRAGAAVEHAGGDSEAVLRLPA